MASTSAASVKIHNKTREYRQRSRLNYSSIKKSKSNSRMNQAIKVKNCQSKLLIRVADSSTGCMEVTTP